MARRGGLRAAERLGVVRASFVFLGVVALLAVGVAVLTAPRAPQANANRVPVNAAAAPLSYRSDEHADDDLGVALELPPGYTVTQSVTGDRAVLTFRRGDTSSTLTTAPLGSEPALRATLREATEDALNIGGRAATKVSGKDADGAARTIFLVPAKTAVYFLSGSGQEFGDIAQTLRIDDSKFR
jgi:hypothetical protein